MKKFKNINYSNYIQKKYFRSRNIKDLKEKYKRIKKEIIVNLNSTKNTLHTLSNDFKFNFKIKDLYKFKKFQTVVVVGMGGSSLGSEAIYFFLKKKIKKNFIFLNNIDEEKLQYIKKQNQLKKVLFIVISKSGNTIETLSNILALQISNKKDNIIVISEKKENALYLFSKKMKLFHIVHKNYIGGRYSVLSDVGMVPAYLMGINILKLRQDISFHLKAKNSKFLEESVIKLSSIFQTNKLKNLIFFNYIPQLDKFLYWNQQLISESLGKKGKGYLPLVSSAPKDHHSLLQLYLDGPKDKLFYIFSLEEQNKIKTNKNFFGKKFNFLMNKKLSKIKKAQKDAFIKILKTKNIPYREFKIKKINEQSLGELFSYFILETIILAKLVNINPFDQPAVEQVKINTKKILS